MGHGRQDDGRMIPCRWVITLKACQKTVQGPSVKDAIARVCGEPEDPPAGKPAKRWALKLGL